MTTQRHDPLKQVAGLIKKLSYEDMLELERRYTNVGPKSSEAARFLAMASDILGPDFDPHAPTTRSRDGF